MFQNLAGNLGQYMDLLSVRQKLAASNIANVDTPGYKTRDIDFQFELMSRLEGASPNIIEPELAAKNDGNNVSLDREARLLAENGIRFQTASLLAKGQFRMAKAAIQEGKNG
jgi:flagellar basal-body rod protein FlgB